MPGADSLSARRALKERDILLSVLMFCLHGSAVPSMVHSLGPLTLPLQGLASAPRQIRPSIGEPGPSRLRQPMHHAQHTPTHTPVLNPTKSYMGKGTNKLFLTLQHMTHQSGRLFLKYSPQLHTGNGSKRNSAFNVSTVYRLLQSCRVSSPCGQHMFRASNSRCRTLFLKSLTWQRARAIRTMVGMLKLVKVNGKDGFRFGYLSSGSCSIPQHVVRGSCHFPCFGTGNPQFLCLQAACVQSHWEWPLNRVG